MTPGEVIVVRGSATEGGCDFAVALARALAGSGDPACVLDLDCSELGLASHTRCRTPPTVRDGRIEVPRRGDLALLSPLLFANGKDPGWSGSILRGAIWQFLHDVDWPGPVVAIVPAHRDDVRRALFEVASVRVTIVVNGAHASAASEPPTVRIRVRDGGWWAIDAWPAFLPDVQLEGSHPLVANPL